MSSYKDEPQSRVRVLIVDDSVSYSSGLSSYLAADPSIMVVAQVTRLSAVFKATVASRPNLVILDTAMDSDLSEVIRRLTDPDIGYNTNVMVLTSSDAHRPYSAQIDMQNAIAAGASSYLFKEPGYRGLIAAIQLATADHAVVEMSLLRELVDDSRFDGSIARRAASTGDQLKTLTLRELDVLVLIGRGLSNNEISEYLEIAHTTVKNHVSAILRKLTLRDRTQAAIVARDFALEHINSPDEAIRKIDHVQVTDAAE